MAHTEHACAAYSWIQVQLQQYKSTWFIRVIASYCHTATYKSVSATDESVPHTVIVIYMIQLNTSFTVLCGSHSQSHGHTARYRSLAHTEWIWFWVYFIQLDTSYKVYKSMLSAKLKQSNLACGGGSLCGWHRVAPHNSHSHTTR